MYLYVAVEIEDYSTPYFDHIALFEVPYRWTSVMDRANTCFINFLNIRTSTKNLLLM